MPKKTYTRILATIGPSSADERTISALLDAGADAFRFNFSHGTREEHKQRYDIVRRLAEEKGLFTTIVADLQGPKLRVGSFAAGSVVLKEGGEFVLDMKEEPGNEARVTLPHKEIFAAIKPGDDLLLNDGNIVLTVKSCDAASAVTEVKVGGELSSHKGVNLPNIKLPISAITEKDRSDLEFALEMGVDWVCLSFVQSADDVRAAKALIGDRALIISKLEKPSAIVELEDIIKLSDGIMVARGDLGVECPLQTVPVLQKKIVNACRKYARPVIVATQMLESMIEKPTPTRAEVSDVATAVYDGADALDYARAEQYDGIILDIMMPKKSGLEVLKTLRSEGNTTPILLLTAKAEVEDRIAGLDMGADDYLPKPFVMGELLSRIRAMLRRKDRFTPDIMTFGNVSLNLSSCELKGPLQSIVLPKIEYKLMELLMLNKGIYLSTEDILVRVWGYESDAESGAVWVYISYVRKRLAAIGADIEIRAKRSVGYTLAKIGDTD